MLSVHRTWRDNCWFPKMLSCIDTLKLCWFLCISCRVGRQLAWLMVDPHFCSSSLLLLCGAVVSTDYSRIILECISSSLQHKHLATTIWVVHGSTIYIYYIAHFIPCLILSSSLQSCHEILSLANGLNQPGRDEQHGICHKCKMLLHCSTFLVNSYINIRY